MKELFFKWYRAVVVDQDESANLILQNLIRWMCSEKSVFYDKFLKQTLDRIVKNLFEDFID